MDPVTSVHFRADCQAPDPSPPLHTVQASSVEPQQMLQLFLFAANIFVHCKTLHLLENILQEGEWEIHIPLFGKISLMSPLLSCHASVCVRINALQLEK